LKEENIDVAKELEMISYKQNKIYLYGEVNHQGKIINNF